MSNNQNTNQNIIYTYTHCSKEDFAHEVNFREDDFSAEIQKIFETSIPISKVLVEFILEDKASGGRFTVSLKLESPKIKFEHQEQAYDNYALSVHKAIKKALEFVRSEKEKLTTH